MQTWAHGMGLEFGDPSLRSGMTFGALDSRRQPCESIGKVFWEEEIAGSKALRVYELGGKAGGQ